MEESSNIRTTMYIVR